jgi:hypothetical protein
MRLDTGKTVHQGGFTRTVGANNRHHFALLYRQRNVVQAFIDREAV